MLLVVDDDRETREEGIISYWTAVNNGVKPKYIWFLDLPYDFFLNMLLFHPEIDCISFDNDLEHQDVSNILQQLAWNDTQAFITAFSNKKIIIHSMNCVANKKLEALLQYFCSDVYVIPFNNMI